MVLQDLQIGDAVSLEINWNNNNYLVHSKVIAKSDYGPMIEPFVYSGTELELHSNKYPNMLLHLYGIDKSTNTRKVWKNISIETVKYADHISYLVRVNNFRRIAVESERRQKKRIPIDCQASVFPANGFARIVATLNDISDGGLSFKIPKNLHSNIDGKLAINFTDQIRGHQFNISVDCNFIHKKSSGDSYIVGCSYTRVDKDLLAYICLKRMEYEAEQNKKLIEESEI